MSDYNLSPVHALSLKLYFAPEMKGFPVKNAVEKSIVGVIVSQWSLKVNKKIEETEENLNYHRSK